MADDKFGSVPKILNGVLGLLIAIVGYFLVNRDAENKQALERIWVELTTIRAAQIQNYANIDRNTEGRTWLFAQTKDHEERLRKLESSRPR